MRSTRWYALLVFVAVSAIPAVASAAPDVEWIFPPGGRRGQSVEATAGGSLPEWPVTVWSSDSRISVVPLAEKGKLQIDVAADAEPGCVWLRLADKSGAAAPWPWIVGAGPETSEVEPNDQVKTAQSLSFEHESSGTVTINGRLEKNGDVDVFSAPVRAGQTIVADLDANAELGAPIDVVMQLLRPDGFVAFQDNDQLKLDPRLAVAATFDGLWMVRIFSFPQTPNSNIFYAGGDRYVYRLTLSTGPVVDYAMPMAVARSRDTSVDMFGWNLNGVSIRKTLPSPGNIDAVWLAPETPGSKLRLPVLDFDPQVEVQPSSSEAPMPITIPASITGRFDEPGDKDCFSWNAIQGERVAIKIASRSLGFAVDPVMELIGPDGQRIVRVDDDVIDGVEMADGSIAHDVAANGELRLVVTDLHGRGGPDAIYRASFTRMEPGYALTAGAHQLTAARGKSAEFSVAVARVAGYSEPITVAVDGLPAGLTCAAATSKVGDDTAATVKLTLTADANSAPASQPFRVTGRSESGQTALATYAVAGGDGTAVAKLSDVWVTITSE